MAQEWVNLPKVLKIDRAATHWSSLEPEPEVAAFCIGSLTSVDLPPCTDDSSNQLFRLVTHTVRLIIEYADHYLCKICLDGQLGVQYDWWTFTGVAKKGA